MDDFLDRLRARPAHERQLLSFAGAGGVTAVIALVWTVTLFNAPGITIPRAESQAAAAAAGLEARQGRAAELGKIEDAWRAELEAMRSAYQQRVGGIPDPSSTYPTPAPAPGSYGSGPATWYPPDPGGAPSPAASTTGL